MAERKIIIQGRSFSFEGLFDLKGLFRAMNKWFSDKGYDMWENKNSEEVYEEGKKIMFELLPYKKVSDYYKLEIRVFLVCENVKEQTVELKGVKHRLLRGTVNIALDGTLVTDFEKRWESRASLYFWRVIIDKFLFKSYTDQYEKALTSDVLEFENEMKSYLNMFRYKV